MGGQPANSLARRCAAAAARAISASRPSGACSTARAAAVVPAGEGTFLACYFWLADSYVLTGRRSEAEALFERLLALGNDVGLFAEEYEPHTKRMLGNFPQAFTHVGLIGAALSILQRKKGEQQLAHRPPTATHVSPPDGQA